MFVQLHCDSRSTPLHEAATAGDDAAIEILLISGLSRSIKEPKVCTALTASFWIGWKCEQVNDILKFSAWQYSTA